MQGPSGSDGTGFRISSFSGGGNCVEVGRSPDGHVIVRDSKDPLRRRALTFDRDTWASFVAAAKDGTFDDLTGD